MPNSQRFFFKIYTEFYLCGDDTSSETKSYSKTGDGLTDQVSKKSVIPKGGQTVLVSDVHPIRQRAYKHINKVHVKPPGWNLWDNNGVKEIMEGMKLIMDR